MPTGRNLLIIFIFIFLLFMAHLVVAQKSQQLVIPVNQQADSGRLSVNIHLGSIQVISRDISNIAVKASPREKEEIANLKARQSGLQEADKNLFDLAIYEKNNEVSISGKSREKIIDLEIEVPLNFSLRPKPHIGGNISAKNIQGVLHAENDYGNIIIRNINNTVNLYSAHGIPVHLTADSGSIYLGESRP